MSVDSVAGVLRAAWFIALLQGAGAAVFRGAFGSALRASAPRIHSFVAASAITAILLLIAADWIEGARLADDWSGLFDARLQRMVWVSTSSMALVVRVAAMLLSLSSLLFTGSRALGLATAGIVLTAASFSLVGHTTMHDAYLLLGLSVGVHALIVAAWFGSLVPLGMVANSEPALVAGRIVREYSSVAAWVVPFIAVAGATVALTLLPSFASLATPYGRLLLAKIGAFAVLMGLAAANKWRFGPAVENGRPEASRPFVRCLTAEYLLICAVLAVTAIMTGFFSPD